MASVPYRRKRQRKRPSSSTLSVARRETMGNARKRREIQNVDGQVDERLRRWDTFDVRQRLTNKLSTLSGIHRGIDGSYMIGWICRTDEYADGHGEHAKCIATEPSFIVRSRSRSLLQSKFQICLSLRWTFISRWRDDFLGTNFSNFYPAKIGIWKWENVRNVCK